MNVGGVGGGQDLGCVRGEGGARARAKMREVSLRVVVSEWICVQEWLRARIARPCIEIKLEFTPRVQGARIMPRTRDGGTVPDHHL